MGAIDCMKWLDEMETVIDISGCAKEDIVKFVSQSFKGDALTWWKALVQSTGKVPLYNLSWNKFVDLVTDTYCPQHEVERIETDFLTLVMKDLDCRSYVTSFNSMSSLIPYLVPPKPKLIARFIGLERSRAKKATDDGKRKREEDKSPQSNKKSKGNSGSKKGQSNDKPSCKTCHKRHFGKCNQDPQAKPCGICKKKGHRSVSAETLRTQPVTVAMKRGTSRPIAPRMLRSPRRRRKRMREFFK
ncbi:putative retrotransposon gag domain-containing protein [Helianthus annuus]|nr:putative retrotransposon gag domain-containing protein [Helianthus annuus]